MITLAVGQTEEALLQNRIMSVPQRQSKTEVLFVVGKSREPVFAPTVSTGASLIVGKIIPRVAVRAVVLANCSPLSLAQVRSPFLPGLALAGFLQAYVFLGSWYVLLSVNSLHFGRSVRRYRGRGRCTLNRLHCPSPIGATLALSSASARRNDAELTQQEQASADGCGNGSRKSADLGHIEKTPFAESQALQ